MLPLAHLLSLDWLHFPQQPRCSLKADNCDKCFSGIGPTSYPFGAQMISKMSFSLLLQGNTNIHCSQEFPRRGQGCLSQEEEGTQTASDRPILQGSVEGCFLWEDPHDTVSSYMYLLFITVYFALLILWVCIKYMVISKPKVHGNFKDPIPVEDYTGIGVGVWGGRTQIRVT